ncbi:MAG: hypothetical protein JNN15_19540, partial [Blastocatellia bacterium]|nr:hypothetical protein [Blastocatellia bacterium]
MYLFDKDKVIFLKFNYILYYLQYFILLFTKHIGYNVNYSNILIIKDLAMKRQYPLHELYDNEFEDMVWDICQDLLGAGTLKFAKGNDGGRDSRFNGTANRFPSEQS